jgi:hypothetical protein
VRYWIVSAEMGAANLRGWLAGPEQHRANRYRVVDPEARHPADRVKVIPHDFVPGGYALPSHLKSVEECVADRRAVVTTMLRDYAAARNSARPSGAGAWPGFGG